MHTTATPTLLLHQLTDGYEPFAGTLLLDDCDATFGKSRMNLKLQGLFTARFQQDAHFTVRVKDDGEYIFDDKPVFFPAAFAGNGRLHPCLAERSIPIVLEPKEPGSPCQPFRFYAAQDSSKSLKQGLSDWGDANHDRFEKIAPYKEDQFPPELSWRHRDCAEPLLQVAGFIGGDWPQRARQALVNAYALAAFEDFYSSRQILSDIRDLFAAKDNPEWISTTGLLEFLHTLDNRAWDTWSKDKPMQPKALAHLLEPFGIRPRNHRTGPKTVPKGYYREDLEPIWRRHLEPWKAAGCGDSPVAAKCAESTNNQVTHPASRPVAANAQNLSPAISGQQLEASSQPLTRPVAAELQNSIPGNPNQAASQSKEPASRYQPKETATTTVAASLQNPVLNHPKLEASSQKPAANSVAAKSAESTNNQVTHPASRAVAANVQNLSPAISGQQLEASSQQLTRPVAANLQTPVPKLEASSQKLAANPSRPMWGADWTNTPPPTHFAGNVKKEGIGYRILKKML
jgi:hypothetical protein